MVAVGGAGEVKPNRKFSHLILDGLWPETSPSPWAGVASAQQTFAQASRTAAGQVSSSAASILSSNDGAMIESMHATYQSDSKAVESQSDLFAEMAGAINKCADIVEEARLQLDAIDREAHGAIQELIDSQKGGVFGGWAVLSMIWAILSQARAAAMAASSAAAANIASQGFRVESASAPTPASVSGLPTQAEPYSPRPQPQFLWQATRRSRKTFLHNLPSVRCGWMVTTL